MCGKALPYYQFHTQSTSKDGFRGKCKVCTKAYTEVYYQKNKERIRKNHAEYYEEHTQESKDRVTLYRATFPEKRTAHMLVTQAIRKGILAKHPCEICGELIVEAHHTDYTKPLDVTWLCGIHHKEAHYLDQ